jgi:hypothetical protein
MRVALAMVFFRAAMFFFQAAMRISGAKRAPKLLRGRPGPQDRYLRLIKGGRWQ